ncbi:unnamed protein product [Clonostachys rosea f. rosea IK726]|uniref:Carboxylic ester hydrolase n=2 Tax=Bionectria ochroleuca TaxID=29856 RepID=A0A0B7JZ41_BIOOC|nr:unnamed protein product [Clonostachys rosea f. rosea IK726]
MYSKLFAILLFMGLIHVALSLPNAVPKARQPIVTLRNGTLLGLQSPTYEQDYFLGVPYASPPVGELRLRRATPPAAWNETRLATLYGPWCYGNNIGLLGYSQTVPGVKYSEDCLQLNIVRPSGIGRDAKLPVLVWLPGGGFAEGSANEPRYNGSFIVRNSVDMGTPLIFVSLNYRLGAFGMLAGSAIEQDGLANIALYDQRQALAWIQENIRQFGGDPQRVTIMGESAGAFSVSFHLLAYGGRDYGLFSSAIAQSGGPYTEGAVNRNSTKREADFNAVLEATDCQGTNDPLNCLRQVPAIKLNAASVGLPVSMVIDGQLIANSSQAQLEHGQFIRVPLLIGANRNECTSFTRLIAPFPINSDEDFASIIHNTWAGGVVPPHLVQAWSGLYDNEVNHPSIAGLGTVVPNPGTAYGTQYGKTSLWLTDMQFMAGRRFAAEAWAAQGVPSYSYFFDTVPASINATELGAAHFQEIPYVFGNEDGVGWDGDPFPADRNLRNKHKRLARIMSRMWISFAVNKSPNFHRVQDLGIKWPAYSLTGPENIVFVGMDDVHVQPDNWRSEAIALVKNLPNDAAL